jgi:hypothetical protein
MSKLTSTASKKFRKTMVHLTNLFMNFNSTQTNNELKEFIWFYFNCDTRPTCLKRLLESYSLSFKQEMHFKNLVISQQAKQKTRKLIKLEEKYLETSTYKEQLNEYSRFLEENLSKFTRPHLNSIITCATFEFLFIIENVIRHEDSDCKTKLSIYNFDKKQMLKEEFISNSFYLHTLIFKCNSANDYGDIFMSSQFNMNNFFLLKLNLYESFACLNLVDLNTDTTEKKFELDEMFKDYLVLPQNHLLLIYETYFEIIDLSASKILKVKVSSTTASPTSSSTIISFCSNLDRTNVLINHEAATTSHSYLAFLLEDFSLKIFQLKFYLNNSATSQQFEIKLKLEKSLLPPSLNNKLVNYYGLKVDRSILLNSFRNEMKFCWKSEEIKFKFVAVINFKLHVCEMTNVENEKDIQSKEFQFKCFDLASFCLIKNNDSQISLIDFYENLVLIMIENRVYCFCLGKLFV